MNPAGSVLLDTSIVIDHFRGDPAVRAAIMSAAALYLPCVAVGELWYGALRSEYRDKQLERLSVLLEQIPVVDVDRRTAESYGRIRSELAEAGTLIPENDIWIAAL